MLPTLWDHSALPILSPVMAIFDLAPLAPTVTRRHGDCLGLVPVLKVTANLIRSAFKRAPVFASRMKVPFAIGSGGVLNATGSPATPQEIGFPDGLNVYTSACPD